jgi:hypothetical protein
MIERIIKDILFNLIIGVIITIAVCGYLMFVCLLINSIGLIKAFIFLIILNAIILSICEEGGE